MPWKKIILTAIALTLAGLLVFLLLPQPLEVDAAKVVTGPLQVTVDDQGETRSHDRFVLSAPVAGRLMRIEVHEGDAVQENQLLAQIAPLPLSAREQDEIVARVASAVALQREAEQRTQRALTDLTQARREEERMRKLVAEGFVSPQAAEQVRSMANAAAIEAVAARSRARAAAADVKVARSGLAPGRSAGSAGTSLVEIRSPVQRHILRIPDASERVVPTGSTLMTIGDFSRLEVVIPLLSSEAVKVQAGMPVLVEGWGGNRVLRAQVRLVEPFATTKVSALGIEEKRTQVIADFIDPPDPLGDGFRINARIVIWRTEQAVKVPSSALFRCGDGWCVFAIINGRATRQNIEIGFRGLHEAEVLKGLEVGQVVVRHPGNQIQEGARVRERS